MVPRILLALLIVLTCCGVAAAQCCQGCCGGQSCPLASPLTGPGDFHGGPPHPDFHGGPGPQPFHGGGWDHPHWGGWGGGFVPPYINPLPYVVPVIENWATAPRSILNPMTGQYAVMTPGYWQATPPGSSVPYIWTSTAIWPLTGKTAAANPNNTQGPVVNFFQKRKPIRRLIGGLIHGGEAVIHKLTPHPPIPQPTPALPKPAWVMPDRSPWPNPSSLTPKVGDTDWGSYLNDWANTQSVVTATVSAEVAAPPVERKPARRFSIASSDVDRRFIVDPTKRCTGKVPQLW